MLHKLLQLDLLSLIGTLFLLALILAICIPSGPQRFSRGQNERLSESVCHPDQGLGVEVAG